jgi:hypothetical protein
LNWAALVSGRDKTFLRSKSILKTGGKSKKLD